MTFYRGKKDPSEKFKKEIYTLLMRPDRIEGARGVIISREAMAMHRVDQVFEQIYAKLRKESKDEMNEKRITKHFVRKKLKLSTPELIEKGISLLSPEEKEKIFASQQKRLINLAEGAIPKYFLLSEEQLTEDAIPDYPPDIQELLTTTTEEVIEKHQLFSKKKKRQKPSARMLFVRKIRGIAKISIREANDLWQEMSKEEQEAYKNG